MKTNALRIAPVTLLVSLLLVPAAALAADQIVKLPDGWRADQEIFAASAANAAVPLRSADPAVGMRILQVRDGQQVLTDIPGAVTALDYAMDGKNLLARYLAVERSENDNRAVQVTKVALVGASGEIAWTKTDDRMFEFSTTGEIVVASREEGGTGLRSDLELFDLAGKHIRTLPVSKLGADRALVLMDGKRVMLTVDRALICEDFTPGGGTVWRYDLARSEPDIIDLRAIAPDKIVLRLAQGRFKLFQPTGTLAYDYDPAIVALTYTDATEVEYAKGAPEPGPNPCTITIFGGTTEARVVQLASSKLFKKFVSLEAAGFKRTGPVVAGKMLFVGSDQILIRSLQDEFKPAEVPAVPVEAAAPGRIEAGAKANEPVSN